MSSLRFRRKRPPDVLETGNGSLGKAPWSKTDGRYLHHLKTN